MTSDFETVEMNTLGTIIDGFHQQSLGIPRLLLRYLELEGEFTVEEKQTAYNICKDIFSSKLNGVNITVAQLAVALINAELILQRREQLSDIILSDNKVDENVGYI